MSVVVVNHLHQRSVHSLHPVNVRPVGIAEHSVCMLDWHLNKQQISTQYSILALFSSSYIIISWKHLVLWIIWGIFSLLWTSMLTAEIFKINVQEDNSILGSRKIRIFLGRIRRIILQVFLLTCCDSRSILKVSTPAGTNTDPDQINNCNININLIYKLTCQFYAHKLFFIVVYPDETHAVAVTLDIDSGQRIWRIRMVRWHLVMNTTVADI